MTEAWAAAQGCMGPWVIVFFVLGGLHASLSVGVTDGPNHGEHPFLVTFFHAIFFLAMARQWKWGPWGVYGGLLLLTLFASLLAYRVVGEERAWVRWGARGGMAALHAAMLTVALTTG